MVQKMVNVQKMQVNTKYRLNGGACVTLESVKETNIDGNVIYTLTFYRPFADKISYTVYSNALFEEVTDESNRCAISGGKKRMSRHKRTSKKSRKNRRKTNHRRR